MAEKTEAPQTATDAPVITEEKKAGHHHHEHGPNCSHDHDHDDHEHKSESSSDDEDGGDGKGKTNRGQKKFHKAMTKLGMKPVTGINRVTVKKGKSVPFKSYAVHVQH